MNETARINIFTGSSSFSFPSQSLAHKLSLCETQPPLARLAIASLLVDPCQQSCRQLLSHLGHVLTQLLCILSISRGFIHLDATGQKKHFELMTEQFLLSGDSATKPEKERKMHRIEIIHT